MQILLRRIIVFLTPHHGRSRTLLNRLVRTYCTIIHLIQLRFLKQRVITTSHKRRIRIVLNFSMSYIIRQRFRVKLVLKVIIFVILVSTFLNGPPVIVLSKILLGHVFIFISNIGVGSALFVGNLSFAGGGGTVHVASVLEDAVIAVDVLVVGVQTVGAGVHLIIIIRGLSSGMIDIIISIALHRT